MTMIINPPELPRESQPVRYRSSSSSKPRTMFLLMFPDRAKALAESFDHFMVEYTITPHDSRFVKVEFEPNDSSHFAAFYAGTIHSTKKNIHDF